MKYLIVNADDFGASTGINNAILELHCLGVLTSTSLMIDMPAAGHALAIASRTSSLGLGLHLTLTDERGAPLVDFNDALVCATELNRQIERFRAMAGRLPTHLDSHQNVHRDTRLNALFVRLASEHGLPLREHSPARYFSSFYGQWDGETHPEHISVDSLLRMIESEVREGITELSCHPGYSRPDFDSPYDKEREIELNTLRDPRVLHFINDRHIKLISFRELPAVLPFAARL